MTSKERLLAAISGDRPDHVPCSFMIFRALRNRCKDIFEFAERQLEMGLDARMDFGIEPAPWYHADLHGLPVRFHPEVEIREWREDRPGERYPVLCKEYVTPAGTLRTEVYRTEDWPYGDRVPFMEDHIVPRSLKHLVTGREDVEPLRYLLIPPADEDLRRFVERYRKVRKFAEDKGLLVAGGWGVGLDALVWLCGMEELLLLSMDDPEFVDELLKLVGDWNVERMEPFLDMGVDLFVRRGWYEGMDLWSPSLFERFVFPYLKGEAELVHQAGAKFGYIVTSGVMPLVRLLIKAGVDVVIGIDPVQDRTMDMRALKERAGGRLALWGGVNGFITVEMGSAEEVRRAVREALDTLGPDGFVLSPVDNVREDRPEVWRNVEVLVETWKEDVNA
ncbi:MAG TPA: hypothetical protein EYP61_07680 [Candidatus Latescibacteria bacterium]|nr:hypothetical protein [Candidatus Latescibacterota bacterium]